MKLYTDDVFAALDRDNDMLRVAGGNETEVYQTDDRHYVVKVKHDMGGDRTTALEDARAMRAAAEQFVACLGPRHTIPSSYLIARSSTGAVLPIVLQPFIGQARPLREIDYTTLNEQQRRCISMELYNIVQRTLTFYRASRCMPDLYGRTSSSEEERKRLNAPTMLPWRIWHFVVRRTLLRSNNLMFVTDTDTDTGCRIILVDYDTVRRSKLYRRIYFATRWFLFLRDNVLIAWMQLGGSVPRA